MENFNAGWYLIYTKPRQEKKVHTQLTGMSINSFLPLTKKLHTWHDRKKYVDEPLFPSYIFIHLNGLQDYYGGMDTEGCLYYVKTGKKIVRVSESVINNIKLVTDQAKDLEVTDKCFQPGQRAVISKGALCGLCCELVEVNSKKMLLVRVDLLQRNIILSLPADQLLPA